MSATLSVGVSYGKIYLFHLAFGFVFFLFILGYLPNLKCSKPSVYHKMMPLMVCWFTLSIIWSWDRWASLLYVLYILVGVGIVFIAVNYSKNLGQQEKMFGAIVSVFIIELVACLLECTGHFRLPISPYSIYSPYFGREMGVDTSIEESILATYWNLPCGFEWNPNNLAAKMLIALPFFLFLKNSWWRWCGLLSVLLVVVFTGSRGAVIASLVVLSLYFIIYVKLNHLLLLYSLLGATVSLCVARFLDFHFLTEAILGLLAYVSWDSINHSDSIGLRQQLILNGFRSLKSTYGLGIGGGADLKMQQIYNNTYYGNHADNLILSMHNFWVELLVNGGAIFFLLFVVWYLMMIHKLHYISKHSYDNRLQYFASSSCLALIGFSLAAISASSVIYFFPMWLLFGFSIATINNYLRMEAK
ncbi:O-antigen ligase family protein [Geobacter hydrogenophilus]|uniref:O-antigen ligase family protein n=1 Tax=Geobacter hydrogenophilus TaxID=40983 RepID=UPI001BD9D147